MPGKIFNILLVEDDPADADLIQECLEDMSLDVKLNIVNDGAKAIAYISRQHPYSKVALPDLILLDLNLPKKNGREVLKELKEDSLLKHIPVLVLTSSSAEDDINMSYSLGANSYIIKPGGFEQFVNVIQAIEQFWFSIVTLPC